MNKSPTSAVIMSVANLSLMFITIMLEAEHIFTASFFIISQIWTAVALIQIQLREQAK